MATSSFVRRVGRSHNNYTFPFPKRRIEDINWKKRDEDDATRNVTPVAEPAYAQTIAVAFGLSSWKAGLLWVDGPSLKTVNGKTGWYASGFWAHSWNAFQRPGVCLRIVADDLLLYDVRVGAVPVFLPFTVDSSSHDDEGSASSVSASTIRFYDGIDNDFDPYVELIDGEGDVGAFNGIRGIFMENLDLEPYNDRLPLNITITWTDNPSELTDTFTLPLLASAANGYTQSGDSWICYDDVLNRAYIGYAKNGEAYIGTTEFQSERETGLAKLTDTPAVPNPADPFPYGGCALQGSSKFIVSMADAGASHYALLVEGQTGKVLASLAHGTTTDVHWGAALPLLGGTGSIYIAGGHTFGASSGMAFAAVDVTNPSITTLISNINISPTGAGTLYLTNGKSNSEGTTFYACAGGTLGTPGKIYRVTFTGLSAPSVTLIWTATVAAVEYKITGLKYDPPLDLLAVSAVNPINSQAFVWGINATSLITVWEKTFGTTQQNISDNNGSLATTTFGFWHRLLPGFALVDQSSGQHQLLRIGDGATQLVGNVEGTQPDFFDQLTGTAYRLDANEWDATGALRHGSEDVTLQDLLTTLLTYDGGGSQVPLLQASQIAFDLTGASLDDTKPKGFGADNDIDLRQAVLDICTLWGIERIDTASGVKFRNRLLNDLYAPDITLAEADLRERSSGERTALLVSRRRDETTRPREVVVNYRSADANYNVLPAKASRPTGVFELTQGLLTKQLNVPLFLGDGVAQRLANRMHKRWIGNDIEHEGALAAKWLKAEPGDAVTINVGAFSYVAQLTHVTKLSDHGLQFRAENFETADNVPTISDSTIILPDPITSRPETQHVFLDSPLLSPAHDLNGTGLVGYHVMSGAESWPGGNVYMRRAGESVFANIGNLVGVVPVIGVLQAALPEPPVTFETDNTNTLTVRVLTGDSTLITSQTEAQYYAQASYAFIGAPGRWMGVTWRNRTVNADGTITLDTLLQGLKGTEPYEGTSVTGDLFVLIRAGHWLKTPYLLSDLLDVAQFKGVGIGRDPGSVPAIAYTISGAAETPRAPGDLDANISGADVALTWDRRSRLYVPQGSEFGDDEPGPLGSDLDVYTVEILNGPGGSVLRTYADVSGQAKTYPAADIASDFGAIPNNLTFRVKQKTSITGLGYGHVAERSVALQ